MVLRVYTFVLIKYDGHVLMLALTWYIKILWKTKQKYIKYLYSVEYIQHFISTISDTIVQRS